MKRLLTSLITVMVPTIVTACTAPRSMRGLKEVDHSQVQLRGGFWGRRLKTHHEVTIPHALTCLENDGHVTNFDKAAGVAEGKISGHAAFDSDLHKALEGAMYCLRHRKDEKLFKRVDGILDRILAAQQDDGFLISYFIVTEQQYRWDRLRVMHQMYNAGHFFEMAVEHYKLTKNPKVLEAARRFADHIDSIFGPGKRYDVDGHQEVELALIKLYRTTGERRYLDLAKFFLDERGHQHGMERKPFDPSTPVVTPEYEKDLPDRAKRNRARARKRDGRAQDHKPVVEQFSAKGHAVRAGYMYAAMADVLRFSKAPGYVKALDSIWTDVVSRKMYVDGCVGTAQYHDEGYGDPYLLPNRTYCETCAAVAHVLWQHRMNLLKGESKYADVMELALYNGVLSGISLSGNQFNYTNPLQAVKSRRPWIGLSCCPTNMARIIPQVGGLMYAQKGDSIYVNLFAGSEASLTLDDGTKVKLVQKTDYPWDGKISIAITPEKESEFMLCVRIPGWALGEPVPSDLYRFEKTKVPLIGLKINRKVTNTVIEDDGYVYLKRMWKQGDVIELNLPMSIRRVYAHEKVEANRGRVALMRGPVVYCLEAPDHPGADVFKMSLSKTEVLRSEFRPGFLEGVAVLKGKALADDQREVDMTAIPRYAWGNRSKDKQKHAFTVWIHEPRK
jgi:DUF1680 family protein